MKEANRRTAEQARETIASILLFDISDPRLEMVTITSCKVSFDRAYCDVYYTVEPGRYEEAEKAFEACKGRIRSLMAKKLAWRKAPELRFHLDKTVDASERLEGFLQAERSRLNPDNIVVDVEVADGTTDATGTIGATDITSPVDPAYSTDSASTAD